VGIIETEFSEPLIAGVRKGRRNNTRNIRIGRQRETAVRVSRGSPEVLVKISGFTKGADHLKAHMSYISRNGKVDLEDQNGAVHEGIAAVDTLWESWNAEISMGNSGRGNQRDTVKIVLSMPPGTDPVAVKSAVMKFAADEFGNHAYVFAMHSDEEHPHLHLTVQMRGFAGERLNPRKADLQRWREMFADRLLHEGVDCVATPRTARNQGPRKGQSKRHAEERRYQRDRYAEPSSTQGAQNRSILSARFRGGVERTKAEWESIRNRSRKIVQAAWMRMAMDLESGVERFQGPHPNYERYERNDEGRRNWRREAALYQPRAGHVGGVRKASPVDSLRDVSSGEVVRHRRPPEGLLQGVSRNGVGRQPEAHYDLRRERDLARPDGTRDGGLKPSVGVTAERNAALVVKAFAESLQQKELLRSAQEDRDMER
jgi:hypothetical protein